MCAVNFYVSKLKNKVFFFIRWQLEWKSVCMHCVGNRQLALKKETEDVM